MDGKELQIISISIVTSFPLIELGCYVLIFHHLFTHDNGNIQKKLLSKECIRKRNRRNATTFLGQVYGFWTEFAFVNIITATIVMGESYPKLKALSVVVKLIEFGMLSMVEVITRESLRNNFIENIFTSIEKIFFMIFWY